MACTKCRLSSSLSFSDSRLLFNKTLTSMAPWTLQEYVRGWILCVPLCAELDATVRKLISLIFFDIFLSKWYRNALIGGPVCMHAKPTRKKYCFGKHYFWDSQRCMRKKPLTVSGPDMSSTFNRENKNRIYFYYHCTREKTNKQSNTMYVHLFKIININSLPLACSYRPAHQLKHSDIPLIGKCQNRERLSGFLS